MDDLAQYASLERYVLARGRQFVTQSASLSGLKIQFVVGVSLITVAMGLLIAGIVSPVHELLYGVPGPLIAGVINAAVGWTLKKRLLQSPKTNLVVSPEARTMLRTLTWAYVWSKNPWVWTGQFGPGDAQQFCQSPQKFQHHFYGQGWRHAFGQSGAGKIPAEVLAQMEEAASNYNRTVGALETAGPTSTLRRLEAKIVQGADEAMLDVLHQGQLVSQYPESMKAIQGRLSNGIEKLRELGDRVESLTLREPTFSDMISGRTATDEVLEELRLEQSAFSELSSLEDDSPRGHLQA